MLEIPLSIERYNSISPLLPLKITALKWNQHLCKKKKHYSCHEGRIYPKAGSLYCISFSLCILPKVQPPKHLLQKSMQSLLLLFKSENVHNDRLGLHFLYKLLRFPPTIFPLTMGQSQHAALCCLFQAMFKCCINHFFQLPSEPPHSL